jgi:hypothetical protein
MGAGTRMVLYGERALDRNYGAIDRTNKVNFQQLEQATKQQNKH